MTTRRVTAKEEIEPYLRRDPYLHLYEIGDLDPFFWPRTSWWAEVEADRTIRQLALLYDAPECPVLIVLTDEPVEATVRWLRALRAELPKRLYTHLSPGLEQAFDDAAAIEPHGCHLRMALIEPCLEVAGIEETERLRPAHQAEIEAFYAEAYPANWFDPRMLATGHYYGWREEGRLVSVAGVHVYSAEQGVAALGNIATLPSHRGRGMAERVTARLCRELRQTVPHIGLNVHAENASAIACYRRLGFEAVAEYGEFGIVTR